MKVKFSPKDFKEAYERKLVRKFKDMKDSYENPDIKGNPVIYVVYIRDFGKFETGYSVINPGNINGEFFMTKGHRHPKPLNEIYILCKGKGKLLIQGKTTEILQLKKGKTYIVPGTSGHRMINTGKKPLEVLTIYSKDAGHDYKFKFKKRVKK